MCLIETVRELISNRRRSTALRAKDVSYVHMAPCIVRGRVGKGDEGGEADVDFVSIALIVGGDCAARAADQKSNVYSGVALAVNEERQLTEAEPPCDTSIRAEADRKRADFC